MEKVYIIFKEDGDIHTLWNSMKSAQKARKVLSRMNISTDSLITVCHLHTEKSFKKVEIETVIS